MTRTIPLAQDSGLPRMSGEGRLRASTPASFRHKAAYSPLRCSSQKASVNSTIRSWAGRAATGIMDSPPVVRTPLADFLGVDVFLGGCAFPAGCQGSDVTMPWRFLAAL